MSIKIVAVSGSPRKDGNTELLVKVALQAAEAEGAETEFVSLRGLNLRGCIACGACWKKKDRACHGVKDDFMKVWEKMIDADGIILGSPVYFGSCTAELKAVMDRSGSVSMANGYLLSGKAGGPVVVARRAGAVSTFSQIAMFYPINDMILVGSTYWNIGYGRDKGEVEEDAEALKTLTNFGKNLATVIKKLKA